MERVYNMSQSTAVVSWKDKIAALTKATAQAERPKASFLSFQGGRMKLGDTEIPSNRIRGVILDFVFLNTMYVGVFNPKKPANPVCYASGRVEGNLVPSENAKEPQNEDCASCPMNEWESDPAGGRGKACKNTRRIAFIPEDCLKSEEDINNAQIAYFNVPLTSVKNFSTFANQCATVLQLPPALVLCEVEVVPDAQTQFKVTFKPLDVVKEEPLQAALMAAHERNAPSMVVEYREEDTESKDKPVSVKTTKGKA